MPEMDIWCPWGGKKTDAKYVMSLPQQVINKFIRFLINNQDNSKRKEKIVTVFGSQWRKKRA